MKSTPPIDPCSFPNPLATLSVGYRVFYDHLCDPNLLQRAWAITRRGGSAPGVDGHSLDEFAAKLPDEITTILAQLRARSYRFLPHRRIYVPKLSGGRRRLEIPAVRDRLVAQAIRLLIEPILSAQFTCGSFAYRCGLGVRQALDTLLQYRAQGHHWILESDIKDFFDSVPHKPLFARLYREPIDPELIRFLQSCVTVGASNGISRFLYRRGIPQGNPLSPLMANYYLTPLDQAMQSLGHRWIRFADDLIVCCCSRAEASRALYDLRRNLAKLQLQVNQSKTRILDSRIESFQFLGFVIHPNRLEPVPENIERFNLLAYHAVTTATCLAHAIHSLNPLIRAFGNFYSRCADRQLYSQLDSSLVDLLVHTFPQFNPSRPDPKQPALVRLTNYLPPIAPNSHSYLPEKLSPPGTAADNNVTAHPKPHSYFPEKISPQPLPPSPQKIPPAKARRLRLRLPYGN